MGREGLPLQLPTVRRYRPLKALDQFIRVKWLTKKAHCSSPERTHAHCLFGKGSQEDHGQGSAVCDQVILQFQTAQTRHLHVGDEAGGVVQSARAL